MIILEESVDLATPTGPMRTWITRPVAPGRRPGLILYSEIFQKTAPIARLAAMLAGHGFVVATPEIFHELEPLGTVLGYDPAGTEAGNRHKKEKPVAGHDADARAVIDALTASAHCDGAIGAMGVCLGGHLAFRAATQPEVRAAACFYATDLHTATLGPAGDDTLARADRIKGELMMVWGRQDPHIDDAGRAKIRARLDAAGLNFTWHEFNAAHAFLRDEGPRYDPALARLGIGLALDLFHRRLGAR